MVAESQSTASAQQSSPASNAVTDPTRDPVWAWSPYRPDAQRPWNLVRAGHLYRRAAFGANWSQLQQALDDGPEKTIGRLLRPPEDAGRFNEASDGYETAGAGNIQELRAWWLRRMIETPYPLLEKMTLFWHSHFAASQARVKNAHLMLHHLQLLRRHALGRFEPLLLAVSSDPAVLVALGSTANRKAQPNQNYARALFENFGIGTGQFSEEDVHEATRAFTGWFVLRNELRFFSREHDSGVKQVFGQKGPFTGEDVVRLVLEQPQTPRFLIRKLYYWLISETSEPSDRLIAPLADSFAQDYDIGRLVETMLRSNLFFSAAAYRQRVKSPVEFALGIVAGLEGTVPTTPLGQDLAALGQSLYEPPTVNGWPRGRQWINSATLVGRSNLAAALLSAAKPYEDKLNPDNVVKKHGGSNLDKVGPFLLDLFLQSDVSANVKAMLLKDVSSSGNASGNQQLRQFIHTIVTLPEFQLA